MRKAKPKKRIILPDPKFGDVRVTKFVNHLMYDGKKNTSYRIFYSALELVGKKMASEEKTPLEIWKAALEKITPQVEVKSRRVGGATFQVPTEIRPDRKESVSMKNMIIFARKRGGKTMADKLAAEIMDAYNEQGGAFKRKDPPPAAPPFGKPRVGREPDAAVSGRSASGPCRGKATLAVDMLSKMNFRDRGRSFGKFCGRYRDER